MRFFHTLARDAMVWPSYLPDGTTQRTLIVVTTLELNPESRKFKADKVERLAEAASEFIDKHSGKIASFVLINRPRDWRPRATVPSARILDQNGEH